MATNHTVATTGSTLRDLPKSWHFTDSLPADSQYPTPAASHTTPRDRIRPRQVRNAAFTWVRPEKQKDPELLAVSPAALRDLGIQAGQERTEEFRQFVAGNKLYGWDEEKLQGGYPWAQCYGGFQFGQWAGQLGDGRAISLFETRNPATGKQYELQLKGAGLTPYSRFADGKAVLRSSIREFVVSEALHALGIPTTRALSLTLLPHSKVVRETVEPGAIVLRFAESWIRLGNFDILRARQDRGLIRKLATYIAEDVFGGWETLPARWEKLERADESLPPPPVKHGVGKNDLEGPTETAENRFTRLYREIARRNARCVASWQAYGFMNGVLNTDNTSVYGLSIDFGPFAFMDNFDPSYTPNHDDHMLRYSYRNQPTIIWWNLVRLGEALGELMGAAGLVDEATFISEGVKEDQQEEIVSRAEKLIMQTGDEYKETFLNEYKKLMTARLGLRQLKKSDFNDLFSSALDTLEAYELDFNHFFRRLSHIHLSDITSHAARKEKAALFFHKEGVNEDDEARERLANWLEKWRARVVEDWKDDREQVSEARDQERQRAMKRVNPNFVPRGWVLDEVIRRVEKEGERDVLNRIMHMALNPFEDEWDGKMFDGVEYKGNGEEEQRWVGDVPRPGRAMQCSCSS
ncbi:hypothetical protein E4U43_002470 [Claviceps pusilla]|uniref:Selenoprotein O n=1 Tax=Claviceps pusilla TaxID=123648 RepID=A0A9P7NGR8_9HYPO|nr:hypothetical protein E4U43_002470 [Claviceps pusilla]